MLTYITRAGDTVDSIAWRQYGRVNPAILQAVLDANQGLADHGPLLPAGVEMQLPDIAVQETVEAGVTLWT